jgi:hypothetical protein
VTAVHVRDEYCLNLLLGKKVGAPERAGARRSAPAD